MFFIYSVFALITNKIASNNYATGLNLAEVDKNSKTYSSYLGLTLGSKLLLPN